MPESLSRVMSMGGDSMSRLSEDSNSSVDSSSMSMSRSYLSNTGKSGLTAYIFFLAVNYCYQVMRDILSLF